MQPEFMRRMKEMSQSGGGGGMFEWEICQKCTNLVATMNSELANAS
jgi:molecular chaperone HtpG